MSTNTFPPPIFRHDFSDDREFREFELPRSHALLTRLHVRHTERRHGIGEASVAQVSAESNEHDGDFIDGHLDGTSDKTGQMAFFKCVGFNVSKFHAFGARPAEVSAATT